MWWINSLCADAVFGWRQLKKMKVTSAAAILSLGLAMGACAAAFRLIDALFLRPLPISDPQRLYVISRPGGGFGDGWEHMRFRRMREASKDRADLIAASFPEQTDVAYGSGQRSGQEMEKAYVQYVSGWMFRSFGLRPALGRLLSKNDDLEPGAHPVAVLSYDYWTRHFARDPKVIGTTVSIARKYGMGSDLFEIVGVASRGFTGNRARHGDRHLCSGHDASAGQRLDGVRVPRFRTLASGSQARARSRSLASGASRPE